MLRPRAFNIIDQIQNLTQSGTQFNPISTMNQIDRQRESIMGMAGGQPISALNTAGDTLVTQYPGQSMMPKMSTMPAGAPMRESQLLRGNVPTMTPSLAAYGAMGDEALAAMEADTRQRNFPAVTPMEGDGKIKEAKSTMESLYDSTIGDREWRLRKMLALNSMRLNPDDSLAAGAREELKDIRARKGSSVTADRLRQMGKPNLAALVEAGQLTGKEAMSLALKQPTELSQMMELYKNNPEMLKALAQMGVFGGDVDMGQGDYLKALAGSFNKKLEGYDERAGNARNLLNGLQEVTRLLDVTDTGKFQETKLAWAETLSRFGFDVDTANIGNMQALRAATNQLVAQELRKNKGPQTDFDAEFTGRFLPGLGQTDEANRQIIKYLSSTQRLELVFGNMAYDALTGKFEVDRGNIGKIDRLKRNAPAVIPTEQGGYVHFATFYDNAIAQGKSDAEIMDAWTTLARGR
jgi:hypothetical protein